MSVEEFFERMPFAKYVGVDVTTMDEGHAEGHLDLGAEHSSVEGRLVAHGGVAYTLADTVAGAAVISRVQDATPTIDMRIDYLAPATGGRLHASADVVRIGSSVATVDVEITDDTGTTIANAHGVYKTGGGDGQTAWTDDDAPGSERQD